MQRFSVLAVLGLVACGAGRERERVRVHARPDSLYAIVPVKPAASPEIPSPTSWALRADSVMALSLSRDLFVGAGGYPVGVKDCSEDEGSDNPTLQAAAVGLRLIGHSPPELDQGMEPSYTVMRSVYRVEVTSAAIFVPQWIGKFSVDSGTADESTYEGIISPRVDTFTVNMGEMVSWKDDDYKPAAMPPGPHWVLCDPAGPAVSEGDGQGFWGFAHASPSWMHVRKWQPAGGTWAQVVALADSAKR